MSFLLRNITALALILGASAAVAQADLAYPNMLDGTMGVEGDLLDDDVDRPGRFRFDTVLGPWEAWKANIREQTGITFGGSFGVLYQTYTDPRNGEEVAAGYKLTLNFGADILNRGAPNALTFDLAIEERGPIGTDLPPLQGGIAAGNVVPTAAT